MVFTPSMQAMVQGAQQGNDYAQRILPSPYQPTGADAPKNPVQGTLTGVSEQLLEAANILDKVAGDACRSECDRLYEMVYKCKKLNTEITDKLAKGSR